MMTELTDIFGSSAVPQVRGLAQFAVTACAEQGNDLRCSRVLSTRQLSVTGPPCPTLVDRSGGAGDLASMVHVSPVEVARSVRTWRSTHAREVAAREAREEERQERSQRAVSKDDPEGEGAP